MLEDHSLFTSFSRQIISFSLLCQFNFLFRCFCDFLANPLVCMTNSSLVSIKPNSRKLLDPTVFDCWVLSILMMSLSYLLMGLPKNHKKHRKRKLNWQSSEKLIICLEKEVNNE